MIFLKSVDSTQKKLKTLKQPENGMIVIADNQTAGIGTHERMWYTGYGRNIAMSFILMPDCPIKKMQNFTVCIAETMAKVLKKITKLDIQIKMPNDLFLSGKKIGGILTESSCKGEIVKKIYVGIGLNVNQEEFPGNLDEIATSLKKETGTENKREDIVVAFLNAFEKEYLKLIY